MEKKDTEEVQDEVTDQQNINQKASDDIVDDSDLSCRFFEDEFPAPEQLVIVEVTSIQEQGTYVQLKEYNNKEALILPNQITRVQRVRRKVLFVGKQYVCVVLNVNKEKQYIDLSRKAVHKKEEKSAYENYAKAKAINSILIPLAKKLDMDLEELYRLIPWKLKKVKKNIHPFDVFKYSVHNNAELDVLKLEKQVYDALFVEIRRRLTPNTLRIKADFELQCFAFEGVEIIKESLIAGQSKGEQNMNIKFSIIGSPIYMGTIITKDKNKGIEIMNAALAEVERVIKTKNGKYTLKKLEVLGVDNTLEEQQIDQDSDYDDLSDDDDKNEDQVDFEENEDMGEDSDEEYKKEGGGKEGEDVEEENKED